MFQDLHKKAWELVASYLAANLRLFAGLAKDAESTILPVVTSWCEESFSDIPECRAFDDHSIICWVNLPSSGVLSVHRYDWCITSVTNLLASYRKNGVAFVIHANRGQVAERKGQPC